MKLGPFLLLLAIIQPVCGYNDNAPSWFNATLNNYTEVIQISDAYCAASCSRAAKTSGEGRLCAANPLSTIPS